MPKNRILKDFMEENFDFEALLKVGFFTKEMKGDYEAQAERVRKHFGYKSVYEYGAETVRCHITYEEGKRPPDEPFVTETGGIYD